MLQSRHETLLMQAWNANTGEGGSRGEKLDQLIKTTGYQLDEPIYTHGLAATRTWGN